MTTMRIYYSCNNYPNSYVDCYASRWDESNYNVIIETWLDSGSRNTLFNNVLPGAVREQYKILGEPEFIDSTYSSGNTLRIEPLSGYGLSGIREGRIIAVKSISDSFVNKDNFYIKIEGTRIDV